MTLDNICILLSGHLWSSSPLGFWRCLQAVITSWGGERKYRLGWYQVDLPGSTPPRPRGWGKWGIGGQIAVGR